MADPNQLAARRDQLIEQVSSLEAEIESLRRTLRDLQGQLAVTPANTPNRGLLERRIAALQQRLDSRVSVQRNAERELTQVSQQLGTAVAPTQPVNSAGQEVEQAQQARDDGASTQSPVVTEGRVGTGATNAQNPNRPGSLLEAEGFTDPTAQPTRTQSDVQVIPPPTAPTPITSNPEYTGSLMDMEGFGDPTEVNPQPSPTVEQGGYSEPDDNIGATEEDQRANDVQQLANRFNRAIVPRANILDQFSSYTYSISIYLMSPELYSQLRRTKQRRLDGAYLLMQSGGAPVGGRNQEFPLDFYIDNLEIQHVAPGKGTGMAHNATTLRFTVFEPNGISLLDRLYAATNKYVGTGPGSTSQSTRNKNYAAQNYLMVIRWYGYDAQGQLVTGNTISNQNAVTDANAVVEKFIPFQLTNIKFKIANKVTEYDVEGACPQDIMGLGRGRGTIPYNIELTATTLQNLVGGNASYARGQDPDAAAREAAQPERAAPDKANAAPSPTLVTGLTQALNAYQEELVKQRIYTKADVYEIRISHPELANAKVTPPGPPNKKYSPNVNANSAGQAKNPDQQAVNTNAKTSSATAGMSIVSFLDLAVRSTDYITKQQTKLRTKDKNGKPINTPQSSAAASGVAWYRIGVSIEPIGTEIDPKRNDLPYKIVYEIAPYGVNEVKSEYFPKGVFRGTQKRYAYWFSGENTSILDFEQQFNYLYYITVNSAQAPPIPAGNANYHEVEKRNYQAASGQSSQGTEDGEFEPAANAADYLYSPADQAQVKLNIIGDPAWIAQGEIWSGTRSPNTSQTGNVDPYFDAFLPDGTINFDSQEALFELSFNKPADYDLASGVMQVQGTQDDLS